MRPEAVKEAILSRGPLFDLQSPANSAVPIRTSRAVWGIRIAGLLSTIDGGFWLVYWFTGRAARWEASGIIVPKANESLCLLLGGVALLLFGFLPDGWPRRASGSVLALVVSLIGLLTFVERVFMYDLGIDQILARDAFGTAAVASPNRMGPVGAVTLILLGAGFLALAWGRRKIPSYMGLAVCVISLVPAVGFLYGAAEFYRLPNITAVAWPTIVALMALGFGLMLADRESGPMALVLSREAGGRLLRKMIPATILVPLALGFMLVFARSRGMFNSAMAAVLLVIALILIFSRFLWQSAADLSRSVKAEAEALQSLRLSEEKFATAFANNPAAIALTRLEDGVFLDVNESWLALNGYSRGEVVGRSSRGMGFWPNSEVEADFISALREKGSFRAQDAVLLKKSGEPFTAEITAHVLDMHSEKVVLSTSVDITERKQAEVLRQALNEQEIFRLVAALKQASVAFIMVDLDSTIRYVNAAFEAINRLPRAQAVGSSYFDLLASDPAAAAWVEKVVAQGRNWHGPLTRPLYDGKPVELELTISPAKDPAGKLVGGLITEKDVTQENALQRQVRQAQKMEALGTLAGGITHDFNNILGTIVINTELALLDLGPNDPGRRPLPLVLQAAHRGKDLVKQIITFSRQREWERNPVEIVPIVTEGTLFLRSILPKDITIRETIDSRSGVVMADPSHIQQIMVNLCQNAALAMPNGGLLEIKLAPVEVDTAFALRHPDLNVGSYVCLTIKDTGGGMSDEVMERIFEPFFTTRGPGRGSGLGLAVVHGIVKSYEGAIIVHSEPNKGSTFDIYLPRLEAETVTRETTVPLEPVRGNERILLVEDEADQRNSLAQALEALGYNVSTSPEGSSALAIFRKNPGAFDVVVTDQIMPRMNGLALAEGIAALRPDIPIILCTGFSEKIDRGVVGRNGVRELIMKPFTVPEITRLIRKVLGPPRAQQDS